MKKFIVTFVLHSMNADGKARVEGAFDTLEIAKDYVEHEIDKFIEDYKMTDLEEEYIDVDYENMSVILADGETGGEWNIEEICL